MHTSFSALDTFKTCPLKYKYQEVDKIRTPQSIQQAFGSLIHKTLKFIYSPTPKGFPTEENAISYFSQNWNGELFKDKKDEGYFELGIKMIKDYYAKWEKPEEVNIIDTEHRFNISIGEHTLGGAIDRIDKKGEKYEIIDYKTDRKIPPQETIDKNLQLSIYLKAFLNRWPTLLDGSEKIEKVKLTLHFLRHNIRISTTRNASDVKMIEKNLLDDINEIEKAREENKFEPSLSPLCDWCNYQKTCPLWVHKFKPVPKKEEDVQKIVKKFIELKNEKKELERKIKKLQGEIEEYFEETKLKQFFTKEGNVVKTQRKTYGWDAKEVGEMLTKWKKDPYLIFKVDGTKLRRFMTKLSPDKQREVMNMRKLERESYGLTTKSSPQL